MFVSSYREKRLNIHHQDTPKRFSHKLLRISQQSFLCGAIFTNPNAHLTCKNITAQKLCLFCLVCSFIAYAQSLSHDLYAFMRSKTFLQRKLQLSQYTLYHRNISLHYQSGHQRAIYTLFSTVATTTMLS